MFCFLNINVFSDYQRFSRHSNDHRDVQMSSFPKILIAKHDDDVDGNDDQHDDDNCVNLSLQMCHLTDSTFWECYFINYKYFFQFDLEWTQSFQQLFQNCSSQHWQVQSQFPNLLQSIVPTIQQTNNSNLTYKLTLWQKHKA